MFKPLFIALSLMLMTLSSFAEFTHETELGVVVTGGNTEVEVYNAKTTNKYAWGKNNFRLGGHYMYGTSFGVENSRNWDVNTKYGRTFTKNLGAFTGVVVEADEFAGIELRTNGDLGASYTIIKKEMTTLLSEVGYRYRQEKSTDGNTLRQSQGRLYLEGAHKTSKEVSLKLNVEYLPNFTLGSDWQLNFEPSFQYNFHSNLALKWGYQGRYDNLPIAGNRKFDFTYTTALLANF